MQTKTLTVLVAISAIAAVLIGSAVHMAFAQLNSTSTSADPAQADVKTITKNINNHGINDEAGSDQKQECQTAGGGTTGSPITASCSSTAGNTATQSGGILHPK